MFKFQPFLDEYKIFYVTKGANTAHGNISIKCPWCGASDPSQHMGINIKTNMYACWRDRSHSGRDPIKLIRALLKCSYVQALDIVNSRSTSDISISDFDALAKDGMEYFDTKEDPYFAYGYDINRNINLNPEFKDFDIVTSITSKFYNYLHSRGFTVYNIQNIVSMYNIKYCLTGFWKNRIIIPLFFRQNLVNWQGRTISDYPFKSKYISLSGKDEICNITGQPKALMITSDILFDFDRLSKTQGDILYITEGVFDVFKLSIYGNKIKRYATCIFTKSVSKAQMDNLSEISQGFDNISILLDAGADLDEARLKKSLPIDVYKKLVNSKLPICISDPGELNIKYAKELFNYEEAKI